MDSEKDLAKAIERIELQLTKACGQYPGIEAAMHANAARIINDECGQPLPSGDERSAWHRLWLKVREKYLAEGGDLAPYILEDDRRRKTEQREESPPDLLPAERAALVFDHLRLVRKYAAAISRQDDVLFSELEALGLGVLEDQAREYDPHRGVTFGAFVRLRLRGAMIDYVRSHRPTPKPERRNIGRRARNSTPRALVQRYLTEGAVRHFSVSGKPLPTGDMGVINELLPKLNQKQRAVYRGRVLTSPPLSRATLARQLGIADETQISRIERQAHRKMAKWLKVSP